MWALYRHFLAFNGPFIVSFSLLVKVYENTNTLDIICKILTNIAVMPRCLSDIVPASLFAAFLHKSLLMAWSFFPPKTYTGKGKT